MTVEENRVFIDLELRGPDGRSRVARTWVDTGGGGFMVTSPIASALGLRRSGAPLEEGGRTYLPIEPPTILVGGMPLSVGTAQSFIRTEGPFIAAGSGAEAFIPGRMLEQYDVIFDYPARTFTIAKPGKGDFRGVQVPAGIKPATGFPRIELTIDGKAYGFLLDTGASYSMVSAIVLGQWSKAHPDWPVAIGAVSEANMLEGDEASSLLRLPHALASGMDLGAMGVVSRSAGTYEDYMSHDMSAPIVGAVAGNVLRRYRVGIDYAHGVTYWEKRAEPVEDDLDSPGLVLAFSFDGAVRVAGFSHQAGKDAPSDVKVGDRLLSIDGHDVGALRRGEVFQLLHGKAGEVRHLKLSRGASVVEVEAPVRHIL